MYGSIAALAARIDPTSAWTSTDTATATAVLGAVSAAIDKYCGRVFTPGGTASTRYYTPSAWDAVEIDDVSSVTSVSLDSGGQRDYGVALASTDYDLTPYNAAAIGEPYTEIRAAPNGRYAFDKRLARSVKVVAVFGWPSVPVQVQEAALLEAARMLAQSQSPSGVVASAELGRYLILPQLHPTTKHMLIPFRRFRSAEL